MQRESIVYTRHGGRRCSCILLCGQIESKGLADRDVGSMCTEISSESLTTLLNVKSLQAMNDMQIEVVRGRFLISNLPHVACRGCSETAVCPVTEVPKLGFMASSATPVTPFPHSHSLGGSGCGGHDEVSK